MVFSHLICNKFHHERIGKNQQGGIIMSEKFKKGWRKVKVGVSLFREFIPIMFATVGVFTGTMLIWAIVKGAIVSVCWNMGITTVFGFGKVTIFQAFVLAFTLECLRCNYRSSVKSTYIQIRGEILNKSMPEKMAKVISVILTIIFELISILITIWVGMYSWNNILPQVLNVELGQINFIQAFSFAYIFNLFFGISSSNCKKSKDDDSKAISKTENSTVTE